MVEIVGFLPQGHFRRKGAVLSSQQRCPIWTFLGLAHSVHLPAIVERNYPARSVANGLSGLTSSKRERQKKEDGVMSRALRIARIIGTLLAMEVLIPGGTLLVLFILVAGRPGSPLHETVARRFPAALRVNLARMGKQWAVGGV
jgi:hypothetical protein